MFLFVYITYINRLYGVKNEKNNKTMRRVLCKKRNSKSADISADKN